ncbi:hypothetical protein CPB84DRAFT_1444234 [Gymnopilus junonius]|uniref:Uncharacterized protein n=1 Tax=Gymnopilus junonius TaxID=109634 RepID=A0A9P5NYN5_GYMJU|nr:hypothetical protein CPB84DRAFT_1444234 [Gymnopilus junonius]
MNEGNTTIKKAVRALKATIKHGVQRISISIQREEKLTFTTWLRENKIPIQRRQW